MNDELFEDEEDRVDPDAELDREEWTAVVQALDRVVAETPARQIPKRAVISARVKARRRLERS